MDSQVAESSAGVAVSAHRVLKGSIGVAPQIPATFVFCPSGHDSPILEIDEKGMTYKGTLIEDAGEAHKAFIEVMKLMRNGVHR